MRASSRAGAAAALGLLGALGCGQPAHEQWCLPPVYERGQRLHPLPAPRVLDLDLLLRQHELCWRRPAQADEARVVLLGASAVFGFPLFAEAALAPRLDARLAAAGVAAHVYNLGFVNPDQVRDAVLLDAALAYRPDAIVYPLTPVEFTHIAPALFPTLTQFFAANVERLTRLIAAPPAGLEEPFGLYREFAARHARGPWARLTARAAAAATLLRHALRDRARRLGTWLTGSTAPAARTRGRQTDYDCAETQASATRRYADWQSWNGLAALEALQRTQGIPALVVFWPLAHEPRDACYNVRFPSALVREFGDWLRRESAARGLAFLDLHDLLPAELFFDSVHVTAEGQTRIAEALAPAVARLVRTAQAPGRLAPPAAL